MVTLQKEISDLHGKLADLRAEVGEIMSLHADQEEKYTEEFETANRHCDHHREEIEELKADNAVMWIRLNSMERRLFHCQDQPGPPISAVGSPEPPTQPAHPESSLEYHTPPIEVVSLHSSTPSPEPLPIPTPIVICDDSPIILSDLENIPPPCCSVPPPPEALLIPIEEGMSEAKDSNAVAERLEDEISAESARLFLYGSQGRGARCRAVHQTCICSLGPIRSL